MARYEAGETLASIARTYDCSPPAISYVVSRSRARPPGAAPPAPAVGVEAQPQLVKSTAEAGSGRPPEPGTADTAQAEAPVAEIGRDMPQPHGANGFRVDATERVTTFPGLPPRAPARSPAALPPAGPTNGDHRRTLHLSLGQTPSGNGRIAAAEPQPPAERQAVGNAGTGAGGPARIAPDPAGAEHNGSPQPRGFAEAQPAAYQAAPRTGGPQNGVRKDGGAFIDQELRARVDGDISAFLAAFDAALQQDTQESRSALREATDRLLRAGARTRIELERLEARLPLPARANGGRDEPVWRQR